MDGSDTPATAKPALCSEPAARIQACTFHFQSEALPARANSEMRQNSKAHLTDCICDLRHSVFCRDADAHGFPRRLLCPAAGGCIQCIQALKKGHSHRSAFYTLTPTKRLRPSELRTAAALNIRAASPTVRVRNPGVSRELQNATRPQRESLPYEGLNPTSPQ